LQAVTDDRLALFAEMESKYEQKDTKYFVSLLQHSDYVVRTRATCILVDFGGEDKVPYVAKVLKNDEGTVAPFVEEQPVVITIMNESGFVVIADEVFPQDRVFSAEYRLDYPLFKQAGIHTVLLRYFDAEQELVFFLSDHPLPQPTTSMINSVNLRVQDVFGNPLDPNALPAGQQVQVAADLTNQLRKSQQFAYIVRIYDLNDTTVSLAWITGVLSPGQSFTAALSWIPSMEGTQIIEVYVWNDISGDIIPLAPEQTLKVQVI